MPLSQSVVLASLFSQLTFLSSQCKRSAQKSLSEMTYFLSSCVLSCDCTVCDFDYFIFLCACVFPLSRVRVCICALVCLCLVSCASMHVMILSHVLRLWAVIRLSHSKCKSLMFRSSHMLSSVVCLSVPRQISKSERDRRKISLHL